MMTKIIVIDAGHGGHDGGAVANGLKEKDLTLDIAKRIQSKLKNYNIKVIMTRTTDKYLTLTERANIANRNNADLFVSIHINAGGGTGFESFIYNGNVSNTTKQFQTAVHSEIMKQINVVDRGKKSANFAVVRQTKMPGILTENLFIDRSEDAKKLKDSKFLDKVAQGHVNGIVKQLRLKKTNTSTTTTKPASKPTKKPQSKPTGNKKPNMTTNSVVEYLQSIGQPYGFNDRKKLAKKYGIKNYRGTSVQNLMLLDKLRKGGTSTSSKTTISSNKTTVRYPLPTSVLRRGSKGNAVKQLQRALNAANFKVGKVDGVYGVKTEDAVRRFQKVHDAYNVDGVYRNRTRTRLNKVVNK